MQFLSLPPDSQGFPAKSPNDLGVVALPATYYYPASKYLDTLEALDEISLMGIPDGRAILELAYMGSMEDR